MKRAIHDVKATDMGLSKVRFKAEVDFDGRVVTRSYLEKQDIDQILNVRCVSLLVCFCFNILYFLFPVYLSQECLHVVVIFIYAMVIIIIVSKIWSKSKGLEFNAVFK